MALSFIKHLWKHGGAESNESQWDESHGDIYQFTINDLDGQPFNFSTLRGKAILITNVACDCGFTKDGYANMVRIKNQHEGRPFEIIGFPSNQYNQEKRSPEEIKAYLTEKFQLNFPLIEKSDINGEQSNTVYEWLKKSFPGDVTWNFSSYFLVNHKGIPVARFEKASWEKIEAAIDEAVKQAEEDQPPAEEVKVADEPVKEAAEEVKVSDESVKETVEEVNDTKPTEELAKESNDDKAVEEVTEGVQNVELSETPAETSEPSTQADTQTDASL